MMFRGLVGVGVASAAIIESRPHEHLQMANAQLQNATDAVIKTAAVAGLAYAGAYMAGLEAGMTTSGSSYDSSRKSQETSTGARYCDTRERNPLNFRCSAQYFNGQKVLTNNDDLTNAVSTSEVAIHNYWCCQAPDLGDQFQGNLDGICTNANFAAQGWSQPAGNGLASTTCVYQGPCAGSTAGTLVIPIGGNCATPACGDPAGAGGANPCTAGGAACDSKTVGVCSGSLNDGTGGLAANAVATVTVATTNQPLLLTSGIFGGLPGGQVTAGSAAAVGNGVSGNGPSFGDAFWGTTAANSCCLKINDANPFSTNPADLEQPDSFCVPSNFPPNNAGQRCPEGYATVAR